MAVLAAVSAAAATAAPPAMRATSYILVDGQSGEVLAARAPDRRLPMASTTKIMTALLAIDGGRPDDLLTVPAAATRVGESSAKLVEGERVSVRSLLTGLLVGSGNDAAITLANGLAASESAFVARMNARARQLGLTNTRYANPHGLDAPGHYSSARDLVAIGRVAMRRPAFRATVGNRRATIPGPNGQGVRLLESENTLLSIDAEADGIKTGHTVGAGYALVAHARRRGLGVGLYLASIGAPSETARARDAKRMFDWGFGQYARPILISPQTVVARIPLRDRQSVVEAGVAAPLAAAIRTGQRLRARVTVPPEIIGSVRAGEEVGRVEVTADGTVIASAPLVARADAGGPGIVDRVRAGIGRIV